MKNCPLPILSSLFFAGISYVGTAFAAETITVNPAITYQTIEAWGTADNTFGTGKLDFQKSSLRRHLIEEAVQTLGITRTRIEAQNGNFSDWKHWEELNDNSDSGVLDATRLETNSFDRKMTEWVVPMKQAVEADGGVFGSYFSPSFYNGGSTGTAPTWLINSPGEHAEYLSSYLLRLKDVYGITPNYYTILNEAGFDNTWTAAIVGAMIKTVAPRLQSLGLTSKLQFPESYGADVAWNNYISVLQADEDIWPHVGMLSYHLYSGNAGTDMSRDSIRDFGIARNLPRAQTEFTTQTSEVLYNDLTKGGVSVWDLYKWNGIYFRTQAPAAVSTQWFSRTQTFWKIRQVTKYVTPGSVRVNAVSTHTSIRPLAFTKSGKSIVVLWIASGGVNAPLTLVGLAPGSYGVSKTIGSNNLTPPNYQEVGVFTTLANGDLSLPALGTDTVVTIYPHDGNLPPTVVDWNSSPFFLTQPASTATLTALAKDPELDVVTYLWSVKSQPAGASAVLATPNAASCAVSGMTAPGEYVFQIAISDPTHTVIRTVEVTSFSGNQPPYLTDVHNRDPVGLTLPAKTSATLRCVGMDLNGDAITYQWSVTSQPPGANVVLTGATTDSCTASGMTVAGNYVFHIAASDGINPATTQTLTVPVFPANVAPTVSVPTASPATMKLAAGATTAGTTLSAVTSDSDAASFATWRPGGDVLTHWWTMQSGPTGAKPVFATPGASSTAVSNLIAGTYVFKVSAMDRAAVTSKTVTVTVDPSSGEFVFSAAGYSQTEGNSGSATKTISVTRAGGSAGAVDVGYATADGSATAGSDYTAASGTLNWADGESGPKTFDVEVLGDLTVEGDETVAISLSSPGGGAALGSPNTAALTISNDDMGGFTAWVSAYELTGLDALETASLAGDGVTNLMKYALGLHPKESVTGVTDGTKPGLPAVGTEGSNLTLLFQKDTSKTDLTYAAEASPDLVTWTTSGVSEGVQSTSGTIQTIKASIPMGVDDKKFLRLNVTKDN